MNTTVWCWCWRRRRAPPEFDAVNRIAADLKAGARAQPLADNGPEAKHKFTAIADFRHVGQGFELRAAMPKASLSAATFGELVRTFFDVLKQTYDHASEDQLKEIITLRVVGVAATEALPKLAKGGRVNPDEVRHYVCDNAFDDGSTHPTPRYNRGKLFTDNRVTGPDLIVQHYSTTLVPPGYVAAVLSHGDLQVARGAV